MLELTGLEETSTNPKKRLLGREILTLSWRRSLSHRNQSIDLLRKSMDWFLYDRDLRHERVKVKWCVKQDVLATTFVLLMKIWTIIDCIILWSSRSQTFFKISARKNFAIFIRKHLCWSLHKTFNYRLSTLLKRDSNTGVFLWILRNFLRTAFFIEHLRWLLLNLVSKSHVNESIALNLYSVSQTGLALMQEFHSRLHSSNAYDALVSFVPLRKMHILLSTTQL